MIYEVLEKKNIVVKTNEFFAFLLSTDKNNMENIKKITFQAELFF